MSVQLQTMLGFVLTAVATLTNRHRKEQEASLCHQHSRPDVSEVMVRTRTHFQCYPGSHADLA